MSTPSLTWATDHTRDPTRPGRFRVDLPDEWTIVDVFGGVSVYAALRAIASELGRDDLDILSAHALFVSRVPSGPATIDVAVLREGRGAAHAIAQLRTGPDDGAAVQVVAIHGRRDEDPPLLCHEPPDVPPPGELAARPHVAGFHPPMSDRTEWRPVTTRPGPAGSLAWERLREGLPDRAALVVLGDVLGVAVEAASPHFILSLDLSITYLRDPVGEWVLQDAEVWHLSDRYATGPARLWDEDGNLCAVVQQTAVVRSSPQG